MDGSILPPLFFTLLLIFIQGAFSFSNFFFHRVLQNISLFLWGRDSLKMISDGFSPSLVTPSGRFDVAKHQVSLRKYAKVEYRPVGLQERQVGGKVNNGAVHNRGCLLHLDLHTQQVNLIPTSTERLSIPPALLFTKDKRKR